MTGAFVDVALDAVVPSRHRGDRVDLLAWDEGVRAAQCMIIGHAISPAASRVGNAADVLQLRDELLGDEHAVGPRASPA